MGENEKEYSGYSVYILTTPDGKKYVGATRQDPHKRWRYGRGYRNQKFFYEAIERFGWNNITHEIVADNLHEKEAMELEKNLISKYKTQDKEFGYNTKNGGQHFGEHGKEFLDSLNKRMKGNKYCVGRKLRQSHLDALRNATLGKHFSNPNKGKHIHSEERKKLFSKMAKERWKDPEFRRKEAEHRPDMSGEHNPMYGKKHTDEAKRKIGERIKGNTWSEERKREHAKKIGKAVNKYDMNMCYIETYISLLDASKSVHCNRKAIRISCEQNTPYKGFYWRYANEDRL